MKNIQHTLQRILDLIKTKKVQLISENGSRENRCWNIAVILIYLHSLDLSGITGKRLRILTRKRLGMEPLHESADKQRYWGDLKAHGDAMGGHGLQIKRVKDYIPLTGGKYGEENVANCCEFIEQILEVKLSLLNDTNDDTDDEPDISGIDIDLGTGIVSDSSKPHDSPLPTILEKIDVETWALQAPPFTQPPKKGEGKSHWLVCQESASELIANMMKVMHLDNGGKLSTYKDLVTLIQASSVLTGERILREHDYPRNVAQRCALWKRLVRFAIGLDASFPAYIAAYVNRLRSTLKHPSGMLGDDAAPLRAKAEEYVNMLINAALSELEEWKEWEKLKTNPLSGG